MKKLTALLIAAVLLLSLCACGNTQTTTAPNDAPDTSAAATTAPEATDYASMTIDELKPLLTTVTAGTLTVATSPDFAPYEFYALDEAGTPTLAGFDMALAQYIADYLGLTLEVVPMDFDGILAEMAAGTTDLGMSGFSPKPEREAAMDFSVVYYNSSQAFVTSKENAALFTSVEDANKAEYSVGAQNGSIQLDLATQYTPEADIVSLAKVTDIIAEVIGGKLDGAFIETPVAECYAKNYPELVVLCEVPYEAEGSIVGVSKGNAVLLAAVNLAINEAIADGSMAQFVTDANELAGGSTYEGLLENIGG